MKSDLTLDASKFAPESVSNNTKDICAAVLKAAEGVPEWYEVGAQRYREMRESGETPIKPRPVIPRGKNVSLPSREKGRYIPCRIMPPEKEGVKIKGIFLHIHGGGWVLGSETNSDPFLSLVANATDYLVISVGYRLAPEHPWPLPNEDCYDIADYLIEHSQEKYGAEIKIIGGDSAGGHLSFYTALHLLNKYPNFKLAGLVFNYGVFSLRFLPSAYHIQGPPVLNYEIMEQFNKAYVPSGGDALIREASPFFTNLEPYRGRLPKALFLVGTNDILMDDSVMMNAKWQITGAEGILRVVPGAPHGFLNLPNDVAECAAEGLKILVEFLKEF